MLDEGQKPEMCLTHFVQEVNGRNLDKGGGMKRFDTCFALIVNTPLYRLA